MFLSETWSFIVKSLIFPEIFMGLKSPALQYVNGLEKGELLGCSPTQRCLGTPKTTTLTVSSCMCRRFYCDFSS